MGLEKQLDEIERYTTAHPRLARAHHWLYDLRVPPGSSPSYVVFGINSGETEEDRRRHPGKTEETSRHDWWPIAHGRSRDEIPCSKKAARILDGASYVQTELFFWSSQNAAGAFSQTYGETLRKSAHLSFCRDMNIKLIDHYEPRAVLFPGFSYQDICSKLYDLALLKRHFFNDKNIATEYTDGSRPWLFTYHWTGYRLSQERVGFLQSLIKNL